MRYLYGFQQKMPKHRGNAIKLQSTPRKQYSLRKLRSKHCTTKNTVHAGRDFTNRVICSKSQQFADLLPLYYGTIGQTCPTSHYKSWVITTCLLTLNTLYSVFFEPPPDVLIRPLLAKVRYG